MTSSSREPHISADELAGLSVEILDLPGQPGLRETALRLLDDLEAAYARLDDEAERIKEYQQLFDIQTTRMDRATALWRAESPAERELVSPDLGHLLDWLIERGDANHA